MLTRLRALPSYALQFSVVSNSLANAEYGTLTRALSVAYVQVGTRMPCHTHTTTSSTLYLPCTGVCPQSKAARLLVWPTGLAHEHCPLSLVESVLDPRNVQTLVYLASLALLAKICLCASKRNQGRRLFALGMIVLPYLPASHVSCCAPCSGNMA